MKASLMEAKLTLSESEVKEAIKMYLSSKGIISDKIKLDCNIVDVGHQMNSHKEARFIGAEINVKVGDK